MGVMNIKDNYFKADIDFLKRKAIWKEMKAHYDLIIKQQKRQFKDRCVKASIETGVPVYEIATQPNLYLSDFQFGKTEDSQCVYMSTYGIGDWGNCDG